MQYHCYDKDGINEKADQRDNIENFHAIYSKKGTKIDAEFKDCVDQWARIVVLYSTRYINFRKIKWRPADGDILINEKRKENILPLVPWIWAWFTTKENQKSEL